MIEEPEFNPIRRYKKRTKIYRLYSAKKYWLGTSTRKKLNCKQNGVLTTLQSDTIVAIYN